MEGHLLAFLDNNNQVMLRLSFIILYKSAVIEIKKKKQQKTTKLKKNPKPTYTRKTLRNYLIIRKPDKFTQHD